MDAVTVTKPISSNVYSGKFGDKHSVGIELHDDYSAAVICPHSFNKIVFASHSLPSNEIDYTVQVDFKTSVSDPVAGLASTNAIDCNHVNFESNKALIVVWFISQGQVIIEGKLSRIAMPKCHNGAIIEITVLDKGKASFTVLNPGMKRQSVDILLSNLPAFLIPFAGATRTGSKFVSFQLPVTSSDLNGIKSYEAYERALQNGLSLNLTYLKFLFFGPPRSGKTTVRRRLAKEIVNLSSLEGPSASTGLSETYEVMIKKLKCKPTTIIKSQWWSMNKSDSDKSSQPGTYGEEEIHYLLQVISQLISKHSDTSSDPDQASSDTNDLLVEAVPSTTIDTDQGEIAMTTNDPKQVLSNSSTDSEIKTVFKKLSVILKSNSPEELQQLLDDITMINMTDVGGQPAFLEMLPALTISPALYLLFFRLDQELGRDYPVKFRAADGKHEVTLETSYCAEEILYQSLSSIACFSCHSPHADTGLASKPQASSSALVFGTYKDRVNESEISRKEDALQKMFAKTELYQKGLLLKSLDGKFFFTVDNMSGTDESEMSGIRNDIEAIIKHHFPPFSIPVSWLIFRIALHLLNKPVVNLAQCKGIAKRLNMSTSNSLEDALLFFHREVGSVMYYSDIPSLSNVVICSPQVIFDCISKLIIDKFQYSNRALKSWEVDEFYAKGIFSFSHIKTGHSEEGSYLTLKQLMDLLKHLNILAEIKLDQETEPKLIMPAMLKYASKEELEPPCVSLIKLPIMIHFEGGFVPFGVFCASIAHLIAHQDALSPRWELCIDQPLHRNKVTFNIDKSFSATLISQLHCLKVLVWCYPQARCLRSPSDMCTIVLHAVVKTLEAVITKMKYKPHRGLSSMQAFNLAFPCCLEDSHSDHLMKIVKDENGRYAKCLKKNTVIMLGNEHLIWFGEDKDSVGTLSDGESSSIAKPSNANLTLIKFKNEQGKTEKFRLKASIMHQWRDIGNLFVPRQQLVVWDKEKGAKECCEEMLNYWLDNPPHQYPATWEGLYELLDDSELGEVASKLKCAVENAV